MQIGDLSREKLFYKGNLTDITIENMRVGHREIEPVSEYLRFFHSTSPIQLVTNGIKQDIMERAAIKIHPGTNVTFNAKKDTSLYEIVLTTPEAKTLEKLTTQNKEFFEALTDKDKEEWMSIIAQDCDYVVPKEKNSEHILKNIPGVLIAPAHSRFNPTKGWNLMYVRGSRTFGIASDAEFEIRGQEAMHKHLITTEIYLCIDGIVELDVNDSRKKLTAEQYLIAEPGELHKKIALSGAPYIGLTMQLPSIPGDKYSPENIRIR